MFPPICCTNMNTILKCSKKKITFITSPFTYPFSCQEGFLDRVLLGSAFMYANTKNHVSVKCTHWFNKVHIFGEGHKILQYIGQIIAIGGDFTKFCGLLRIYEL